MNRRAMILPFAVAVAVSLSLSACGDDKNKKLSKSELISKANAICKTAKKDSNAIKPVPNLQDPAEAAAYFTKIVPITQKQADDLAALKPPDAMKADWTQFVDREKQADGIFKVLRDKAKAKDLSGFDDLAKANRIGQKLTVEANAVGATTCASE